MTLNRYTYSLADEEVSETDFTTIIAVGSLIFTCRFLWSIVSEEQYTELQQILINRAQTDPLTDGKDYMDRTYDWLSYYKDLITLSEQEFIEWFDVQQVLPSSWRGRTASSCYISVQEQKGDIEDLSFQNELYQESLVWQCEVHQGDDKVVTTVRPGGWIDYGTGKAFRFVAPARDTIGKDDLQYVTMEFDIHE